MAWVTDLMPDGNGLLLTFLILIYCLLIIRGTVVKLIRANMTVYIKHYGISSYNKDEFTDALAPPTPSLDLLPVATDILVYPAVPLSNINGPIVPRSVCQRLENMGPEQFMRYLTEQLDLTEREIVMRSELLRKRSFDCGWPNDQDNHSGNEMARAGFYYTGQSDLVKCAFCRVNLHTRAFEGDPNSEHRKSRPDCRFVKDLSCGNIEHTPPSDIRSHINLAAADYERQDDSQLLRNLGIKFCDRPAHPDYSDCDARLKSFNAAHCELSEPMTQACCKAGFFFYNKRQWLRCYQCDVRIPLARLTESNLSEIHANSSPDCNFLIQNEGKLKIEQTRTSNAHNRTNTIIDRHSPTVSCHFAEYPDFANNGLREESLRNFCSEFLTVAIIRQVAEVGFFFDDISKSVRCFYCSGELSRQRLENTSDFWMLHAQTSPDCIFLTQKRGINYTQEIVRQSSSETENTDLSCLNSEENIGNYTGAGPPRSNDPSSSKDEGSLSRQMTCSVCLTAYIGIIFIPCLHFVTCARCASRLVVCPICRAEVYGIVESKILRNHQENQ